MSDAYKDWALSSSGFMVKDPAHERRRLDARTAITSIMMTDEAFSMHDHMRLLEMIDSEDVENLGLAEVLIENKMIKPK